MIYLLSVVVVVLLLHKKGHWVGVEERLALLPLVKNKAESTRHNC